MVDPGPNSEMVVKRASPDEVRRRLVASCVPMRSLWFASLKELRRWDQAHEALYVRRLRSGEVEVGPRLASLEAARFSPVFRATLQASGVDTVVRGAVRLPGFVRGLLGVWAVVLTGWFLLGLRAAGEQGMGWLVFWGFAAAITIVGAWLGRTMGGKALREAWPEFERILRDDQAGADDW